MAKTTFSTEQKAALSQHGLTAAHFEQLSAAGCDPATCATAIPQLKSQVEAAGFDFGKWLDLFMKVLPLVLQFFGPQPAPTPVNPNVPPATA